MTVSLTSPLPVSHPPLDDDFVETAECSVDDSLGNSQSMFTRDDLSPSLSPFIFPPLLSRKGDENEIRYAIVVSYEHNLAYTPLPPMMDTYGTFAFIARQDDINSGDQLFRSSIAVF